MMLKQMVKEQAELLQQQRTNEYREAQSRSIRQSIIEEYGEGEVVSGRESVHTGGVPPSSRTERSTLPLGCAESQNQLPYSGTLVATRQTHGWEDETP